MITVIAEKPSVARDIASYLGATSKKDGYIEGNGYSVTWAFGHLVEIKDFKELGYSTEWKLDTLPFIPHNFELKIKTNSGAAKQFNIIKGLFKNSTEIICATDAGREGELIFRYIYDLSKSTSQIKRLWISSLTDKAIQDGFEKLKNGNDYLNLYYSAKARNQADYLVGINSTIGLTTKASTMGLLSLGRVQTPTLALICERFILNSTFKSTNYYTLQLLLFPLNKKEFTANFEKSFNSRVEAESVLNTVPITVNVKELIVKETIEHAPTLFDLTLLQRECNRIFGFSAQKTLDLAQGLYEKHKILSYPRTSSKYLSDDMLGTIPGLLNNILLFHDEKELVINLLKTPISKRPIDNEKVSDHHAIIPTEIQPSFNNLSADELKMYHLVINRFIQAFMTPCIKDVTTVIIETEKGSFTTNGTAIKSLGWKDLEKKYHEEGNEEDQKIPSLKIGEKLSVIKKDVLEKKTKAPAIFTESSLLHSMETAGKLVDNDELSKAMKEGGLGTPATRASIIEILLKRDFITRNKKEIHPTTLGLNIYNLVKDLSISKADLTAQWEYKLNLIASGEYDYDLFNEEIVSYTKSMIDSIKSMKIEHIKTPIIECCFCKKANIIEVGNAYKCENDKCNFPIIWKRISDKIITSTVVKDLVLNKKSTLIKGFKNKNKKSFDAYLIINEETKKLQFDFTKDKITSCIKCEKGDIVEYPKAYGCTNKECVFVIFKDIASKAITSLEAKNLILNRKSGLLKNFVSSKGKKFDAYLIIDDKFEIKFGVRIG